MTTDTIPRWQFLPPMSADDYDRLKESMQRHGFMPGFEVVVTLDGRILDGHHRARAAADLGIEALTRTVAIDGEDACWDYVYLANVPRRHMSVTDKLALVRKYIDRHSEESDRSIAAASGVSPSTVGKLRREMGVDNPEGVHGGRNGQQDYQDAPAENVADHRKEVYFETRYGYACESDDERNRGVKPYVQASERLEWLSGRCYLTVDTPRSLVEFDAVIIEQANMLRRLVRERPWKTMAR